GGAARGGGGGAGGRAPPRSPRRPPPPAVSRRAFPPPRSQADPPVAGRYREGSRGHCLGLRGHLRGGPLRSSDGDRRGSPVATAAAAPHPAGDGLPAPQPAAGTRGSGTTAGPAREVDPQAGGRGAATRLAAAVPLPAGVSNPAGRSQPAQDARLGPALAATAAILDERPRPLRPHLGPTTRPRLRRSAPGPGSLDRAGPG